MLYDQRKSHTQRPTKGNGSASLEYKDSSHKIPEIASVLDDIDKLLESTKEKPQKQDRCRC